MVGSTSEVPAKDITAATSTTPWSQFEIAWTTEGMPLPLGALVFVQVVPWVPGDGADRPLAPTWATLPLRVIILKHKELLLFLMGIFQTYLQRFNNLSPQHNVSLNIKLINYNF